MLEELPFSVATIRALEILIDAFDKAAAPAVKAFLEDAILYVACQRLAQCGVIHRLQFSKEP